MSKLSPLIVELIEKRPRTAAKVLAAMSANDAAEFFEVLPTRYAVTLFSTISAWSASTLVAEMTPISGAAVLSELDYQTTASIMRMIPDENRAQLMSALPKKLSRDLTATLTYPTNTVGAKMSTNIVTMNADQTVGDAFSELRQMHRARTGVAFVVGESRKLLGVVSAGDLFQLQNQLLLGDVIDRSVAPISARARLSMVKSLPAWDDYAYLPVVNRQKMLIGALARRAFRQSLIETQTPASHTPNRSILGSVAGAFFSSSVGMAQVLIDLEGSGEPTTGASSRSGELV